MTQNKYWVDFFCFVLLKQLNFLYWKDALKLFVLSLHNHFKVGWGEVFRVGKTSVHLEDGRIGRKYTAVKFLHHEAQPQNLRQGSLKGAGYLSFCMITVLNFLRAKCGRIVKKLDKGIFGTNYNQTFKNTFFFFFKYPSTKVWQTFY